MSAKIFLGVDIGTTSTKCLAVREDGEVVAVAQHHYSLTHSRDGWAEQDPNDFREAVTDVVCRCLAHCKSAGFHTGSVESLGMSTQGGTLLVCDDLGRPLYPAISWMDSRAVEEYKALIAETGDRFWYEETGQPLNPVSTAAKIRWLQMHEPEIADAGRLCYVPDFLAKWLCGRWIIDVPSASFTTVGSIVSRSWSEQVLGILRVSSDRFSLPVESGTIIGDLLPEVARDLGLSLRTRVIAGSFDQAAAAHGSGAAADGRSVLSCGTAWVLYSVSDHPALGTEYAVCNCCHVRPNEWGVLFPFAGGSVYDWYRNTFGDRGGSATDSKPPVFIPHLYGGLSPDWRSESRGSILGLTMSHTWEDIRLALMRGIAFEVRRNLEAGEALAGAVKSIRMVGGASQSSTWPQIVADVLNRPVEVSDFAESACYGAAMLAAGSMSGGWSATDAVRVVRPSHMGARVADDEYHRYLDFYYSLVEVYQRYG